MSGMRGSRFHEIDLKEWEAWGKYVNKNALLSSAEVVKLFGFHNANSLYNICFAGGFPKPDVRKSELIRADRARGVKISKVPGFADKSYWTGATILAEAQRRIKLNKDKAGVSDA